MVSPSILLGFFLASVSFSLFFSVSSSLLCNTAAQSSVTEPSSKRRYTFQLSGRRLLTSFGNSLLNCTYPASPLTSDTLSARSPSVVVEETGPFFFSFSFFSTTGLQVGFVSNQSSPAYLYIRILGLGSDGSHVHPPRPCWIGGIVKQLGTRSQGLDCGTKTRDRRFGFVGAV